MRARAPHVFALCLLLGGLGFGLPFSVVAQITVTGTADDTLAALDGNGTCDLREAIEAANTNGAVGECPAGTPGLDTIAFALSNGEASLVITLTAALPTLNAGGGDPIILDGTSQAGASCPSTPTVILSGQGALSVSDGLTLGDGNTVRGLNIQGFLLNDATPAAGIVVNGSNNHIACTFIGTTVDGGSAAPNGIGIHVAFGANNVIGSNGDGINDDEERNLISGQDGSSSTPGIGIWDEGAGTTIAGNVIGTDDTGRNAVPNVVGMQFGDTPQDATGKTLGVVSALVQDNFIANNTDAGIDILTGGFAFEDGSEKNCIVGNTEGARKASVGTAIFENNWWGATDGPGGDGPGSGDTISEGIDAVPFLTVPAKACALDFKKTFTDDPVGPGGTVTLQFTLTNPSDASSFTNIAFTDTLDHVLPGLTASGLPASDVCGSGSLLTVDAAGTLALTGGRLAPGASCTFQVTLQVPAEAEPGSYFNTTSDLTGTINAEPVTLDPAGDTLVVSALLFTKSFTDDPVFPDETVTLAFTITNAGGDDLEDISFLDNVEAVLPGLAPSSGQLPLDGVCGDGSRFDFQGGTAPRKTLDGQTIAALELTGGLLDAGASCTFSLTLDVPPGAAPGAHLNSTTEITSSIVGSGGEGEVDGEPATDFLVVFGEPDLQKAFTDDPVGPGGAVTLQFTLTNPDPVHGVREIAFTDDLEAMLTGIIATSFETTEGGDVIPLTDVCGAGSMLDFTEAGVLIFTGGVLPPDALCTFSVTLAIPAGAAPDIYTNAITDFTAEVGGGGEPGAPFEGETVTDDLEVAAVPVFTKVFIGDPVLPGEDITLRFTLTNTNPTEAASGIGFTDDLDILDIDGDPNTDVLTPLGVVMLPADGFCGAGSMLTETDGVLTMTGGTLPADGTCTFDVLLNVPETIVIDPVIGEPVTNDLPPGTYRNTTSRLSSTVGEDRFESQPASDDFLVAGTPTFIKRFADDAAVPGGTVTLQFTLTNPDPNDSLTDIAFTDTLDNVLAGLVPTDLPKSDICGTGSVVNVDPSNVLVFINGSLDPQADCTFDVTLQIPAGAAPGSYRNTTSTLTATLHGAPVTVDPAVDDLDIGGDLTFTKAFTDDPVAPGGAVTLAFTIRNGGAETATDIAFLDNLEAMLPGLMAVTPLPLSDACGDGSSFGFPTAALDKTDGGQSLPPLELTDGTLAPGETCMFSVELVVPLGADPGEYTNTTTELTATINDGTVTAPPATDVLFVAASLSILKSFTDDPALPGGTVTLAFTIAYEAGDEDPPLTGLTFTDDLEAVLADLRPSAGEAPQADVCGDGSTLSEAGGVLTLADGTLSPGASCTFSVVLDVPVGARAGVYTNVTSELEGNDSEDRVSAKNLKTAITAAPATDDLVIAAIPVIRKEFTDDPVAPGGTVTLAFTITNPNPTEEATAIAFTDDLDAVLAGLVVTSFEAEEGGGFTPIADVCGAGSLLTLTDPANLTLTGGSLDPDTDCTFNVTIAVPASAALGSYLNETTALTAEVDEEPVTGNTATDNLDVAPLPLLIKRFTDDPVAPGGTVTLEFTLTNTNLSNAASAIAFTDDLDAVLPGLVATGLPASVCGGTVATPDGGSTIEFTGGTLAAGASCTFSVVLAVPDGTSSNAYSNVTSSISAQVGGNPVVGSPATDALIVAPVPMLVKAFTDNAVLPGGTVTLEFSITYGEATVPATAIAFTDDLDAVLPGLTAVGLPLDDVCGTGSRIDGTSVLTLTGGSLDPESTCSFSVTLQVPTDAEAGIYTNETSDLTADVDGLPVTGAPATDDLQVLAIALSKSFTDDPVASGGTVTLAFTLTNADPSNAATDVAFTDDLDAVLPGLVLAGVLTNDCGGTVSGTSTISVSGAAVAAGASCTITASLAVPGGADAAEYTNTTSEATATVDGEAVTAPPATDVLIVSEVLTLLKAFTDDPVAPGGTVTLEFNLAYEAEAGDPDATGLTFTDDLGAVLAGLAPAAGEVPQTVCGGGTLSEAGGVLTLADGTLSPGASCTFSVVLDVPADAPPGSYTNVTSAVEAQVEEPGRLGSKTQETITGDPAMDDLEVAAIPVIRKEFTDDPVAPSGTVTLEFTLTNPNPTEEATALAFTDDLDAVLSGLVAVGLPASDVCGTGSMLTGTDVLALTGGSLPPGGVCTFNVTLQVPAGAGFGTYTNETDALTAEVDGASVTGNTATDDLVVEPLPLLEKRFTDDPAAPGGTVTLAFTITNTDPSNAATDVAFTDDLDAVLPGLVLAGVLTNDCGGTVSGTSTISFSGGTVAAGASCMISVSLTIPADAPEGDHTNTTSTVTAQVGGSAVTSGTASDVLQIVAVPVLSKAFIDDPVQPGGTVTLEFVISHEEGTLDATNLAFTDALGAGLLATGLPVSACGGTVATPDGGSTIEFSGGSLTAGAFCTFSVTLDVPGTATPGSTVPNTTSALTADVGGVSVTGDPASDDLQIAGLLSLTKEFTDDPVAPGGTVTLAFTLTNADPSNAATGIAFTDDLDAALPGLEMTGVLSNDCGGTVSGTSTISFSSGTAAAGASCTITASLAVPGAADAAEYTNITSEATATIDGETVTAPPATDVLTVAAPLTIEKSFTDDPVAPGATVTLSFTIAFEGETEATALTFTDDLGAVLSGLVAVGLPANNVCGAGSQLTGTTVLTLTGGRLDPGTACTFSVTLQVPATAPNGDFLNTTSAVAAQVDGEPVDGEPAIDVLTVATEATIDATKADELLDTDGLAHPGDVIRYTVVIANNGDRDANGVRFTDTVDPNTSLDCDSVVPDPSSCTPGPGGSLTVEVGTIEDGETATVLFEVAVVSPYPAEAPTVENQGLVEGDTFSDVPTDDPDTEADDDPTVTEITRESDFALTKTADPATPDYLGTVVFTLTVTNNGPVAGSAEVTDILPDGLVFVEADPAEDYDEDASVWTTDEIAVGESRVLTITALVDTLEPVTNEAVVASARFPDPVAGNNSAAVAITPVAADLGIVKTLTAFEGIPPDSIRATFRLTVTNHGPSAATGVFVDDPLPEGATLEGVPADYDPDTGIWTIGDLDNGATVTLILVMLAEASNDLLNIAVVAGDQPDQEDDNNLAASQAQHDRSTSPALSADLSLTKTVDNETPAVGDTLTYTLTLTNGGPSGTAGVTVRDAFPADSLLRFLSATTNTASSCCFDDSLWLWSASTLPAGATRTLEIKAVVVGTGEIVNTAEILRSTLPDPDSQFDNDNPNEDDQDSATIMVAANIVARAEAQVQAALMEAAEAPTAFELGANYPNPFNPETTIPYAVPEAARVRIAVYDLLGRQVAVLLDEARSVGRYTLTWRADTVPTGVYLVRMQAEAFVAVRRITLIK